jgi:hypothetical protein
MSTAAEGHAGMADARARTRQPDRPRDQRDALRVRRAVHRRRVPRETELGLRATPLADAVEQTVRWYRAQANPSPAADHAGAPHAAPGLEPN